MTLWELGACVEGYNAAHGSDSEPPPLTSEEADAMIARARPIIEGKPQNDVS